MDVLVAVISFLFFILFLPSFIMYVLIQWEVGDKLENVYLLAMCGTLL